MGTAAAAAFSVASTVVGGIMQAQSASEQASIQRQQAEYQAQQYEFNAERARTEANDIAKKSMDEERAMRQQAALMKGKQRATAGAAGLDTGAGSTMDLLRESALIEDEDAQSIHYNSKKSQGGRIAEAQQSTWNAQAARTAGENQARATTNAGRAALWGSLLKGGSMIADKWDSLSGTKRVKYYEEI